MRMSGSSSGTSPYPFSRNSSGKQKYP
jgi:hypothetical protein